MSEETPARGGRVVLSLVSHTNVGKTTLARTLLRRDVGEVRDEAHVTQAAEPHLLIDTPGGDRLELWDTPGFGDSVRLARRLEQAGNPIGWFLSEVWDRFRDRAFWSTQKAIRHVIDESDVVLYLVNASESPEDATYLDAELQVLELLEKPVVALLNQLGRPRAAHEEASEIARWESGLRRPGRRCVRAVLALDAFARCWIHEHVLLDAVSQALPASRQDVFARLRAAWLERAERTWLASVEVLARDLLETAGDRQGVVDEGWSARLRSAGSALGLREGADGPREKAMAALVSRLGERTRASTDALIALHELQGRARDVVLERVASSFAVTAPLHEGKAALWGGVLTGALAGLKADLATGGLTLGGGLLAGGLLGALGAAGLARGFNLIRGTGEPFVQWSDEALRAAARDALLRYLAVAHYGRGRGEWTESEHPAFWGDLVDAALAGRSADWQAAWRAARGSSVTAPAAAGSDAPPVDPGEALLRATLEATGRDVLARLDPRAVAAAPAQPGSAPRA